MKTRVSWSIGLAGLMTLALLVPASAQQPAPQGEPSAACRLFPLACPGPTPPPPEPLLGPPEEQMDVATEPPPAPAKHVATHRHRARKHAAQ